MSYPVKSSVLGDGLSVVRVAGTLYTFSLRYISRPRGFFGSMPFTAVSMTRSGP